MAANSCIDGTYQIDNIDNIITIIIILLIAGFFGGAINSITQDDGVVNPENTKERLFRYTMGQCFTMGIGASLLVPLFLETISSSLIQDSRCVPQKYLVIMGFAIVASITSRTFIRNISNIALKNVEKKADDAILTASLTQTRLDATDIQVDPAVALAKLEEDMVSKEMQEFPDAWAWKGYYQKRMGNYEDAVKSLNKAISLSENKGIHNWSFYYNSSCYKALAKYNVNSVLEDLKKALHLNSKEVIFSLQNEPDFAEIKKTPEFKQLLSPFSQKDETKGDIK